MNRKIGRNDPCPCGSGRKYKHCHLGSDTSGAQSVGIASHAGVVQRVVEWLSQRHSNAMRAVLEETLFGELWPEDAPDPQEIEPELWEAAASPSAPRKEGRSPRSLLSDAAAGR